MKKEIKNVVKNMELVKKLSKKGTAYFSVEIELSNSYKESLFLTPSLSQMINILAPEKPQDAISKIEILDRVSKDGVAYRVCNITTIEGYDEALFLPRALNKLIDILRKKEN